MNGHCSVLLLGRICSDEGVLNLGPNKTPMLRFTVVLNRKYNGKEEAHFIDCEMWGERAMAFAKYHTKGSACYLQGELKQDRWVDKQTGEKRNKLKVNVHGFSFLPKTDGGSTRSDTDYLAGGHREPDRKYDPTNQTEVDQDVFGPDGDAFDRAPKGEDVYPMKQKTGPMPKSWEWRASSLLFNNDEESPF